MKKSRSTRSHFTHARSCCARSIEFPRVRNDQSSIRTYSLWKGDIFPCFRFTGYKKSNQNQFERVLPFAFALTCYKTYLLFSSLSYYFDSFSWREHLSYGVKLIFLFFLLFSQSKLLKHHKQGPKFAVQQSPLISRLKVSIKTTQISPFFDVCLALI